MGFSRESAWDRSKFSSELHADLSRILGDVLGVEHNNQLVAGPMTVDCCHMPTMTVVEAAARWQFYIYSTQVTALARRRQEMLRAMGFRVVQVPFHRWEALSNDEEKAEYLRSKCPSDMFINSARNSRLPTSAASDS